MTNIYICKHHTFYGYQENENADVALVTNDETKARAWCDSFKPIKTNCDVCEWRSYTKMKLDHDYAVKNEDDWHDYKFEVNITETYTQNK